MTKETKKTVCKASMREIGRRAGDSPTVVSHVLNNTTTALHERSPFALATKTHPEDINVTKTRTSVAICALLIAFSCIMMPVAVFAADPIRVMPLGDSLTLGWPGSDPADLSMCNGYRLPLKNILAQNGIETDFVGSLTNGTFIDNQHEGHEGYTIDQISQSADTWLATAAPDVVLLMAGTNNIYGHETAAAATDKLADLIDQISLASPDTHIIVSTIPPIAVSHGFDATIIQYNSMIPGLITTRIDAGMSISFADCGSVVSQSMLYADGVHMTLPANNAIANVWEQSIAAVTPEPGTIALLTLGGMSLLRRRPHLYARQQ